ncbi:hypothetical protein PSCICJ_09740 [Pseudomonas cichorii]|uniref:hypothetical protein n=1 Tax=Pseudomonas cichorii TaxID=36746 RepID=UPI00191019C2|nr:hypothetical protein [Pseudomonas cichorii]GFM64856.1 hypothetical protein PSCICJ_09740 [Pseudomonas cichorii]
MAGNEMKSLAFFVMWLFSGYVVSAENSSAVVNIYKADTGLVSGKLVRYYQMLDNPCVKVQILKPGAGGASRESVEFCSIDGKDFSSDYAEVMLDKGEFSSNELSLVFKLLPLAQDNEQVKVCKFKIEGEKFSKPNCFGQ